MALVMYPRKRPMRGEGLGDFLGNALKFTKSNQLVSRGLATAAPFAGSYAPVVGGLGAVAGLLGWGKKRRPQKAAGKKKKRKTRR